MMHNFTQLANEVWQTANRIHDDCKGDISQTVLAVGIDIAHRENIPRDQWKQFALAVNIACGFVTLKAARKMGNAAFLSLEDTECPFDASTQKAHWEAWFAGYYEGV